ncbi:MAG: MarR family transcriptional regulator [Eubacteriales bacterium]
MEGLIKKIMSISRAIGTKNFEFMKERGYRRVGIGQLAIARIVLNSPGVYADDICRELELDKATVAIGIKHLIVGGFIRREVDENDKRRKKLFATDKLLDVGNEIKQQIGIQIEKMTQGFTKEDLEIFEDYLDRIKTNMSKED